MVFIPQVYFKIFQKKNINQINVLFNSIGLFKIEKEDYNTIKECIEELVFKLSEIKQINIKNIS